MKKEFMLFIRNAGDAKKLLSPEAHLAFVQQCEVYIDALLKTGQLLAAQPLYREGIVLTKNAGDWNTAVIDINQQVQVGYYHLRTDTIEDAVSIAKNNPEFAFVPSASIEIKQIKTKEDKTGFVYPGQRKD